MTKNEKQDLTLPEGLRIADVVAKAARVTLKDTMRVMAAIDAVAYMFDVYPDDVISATDYQPNRPDANNVAACERAFFDLTNPDGEHEYRDEINTRLKVIKKLK